MPKEIDPIIVADLEEDEEIDPIIVADLEEDKEIDPIIVAGLDEDGQKDQEEEHTREEEPPQSPLEEEKGKLPNSRKETATEKCEIAKHSTS